MTDRLGITLLGCLWVVSTFNEIISASGYQIKEELEDYLKGETVAHKPSFMTQSRVSEVLFPDLCPPPKTIFSDEDCYQDPCLSHANCTRSNEGCCFNGCIFTCLPDVFPSAFEIDWSLELNQTVPVSLERNEDEYEIKCSTSKGSVVPSCPTGYTCRILEYGDPLRDIPNRGVCLNIKDLGHDSLGLYIDEAARDWSHLEPSVVKESVYLPGGCFITTEQYSDIEDFIRGKHFTSCTCSAGTVLCSVPQNKTNT